MEYYMFRNKKMPWGDYGNTLLVGYAFPSEDNANEIFIERAGPFVPPVYTWANMLLVSDSFKKKLEKSDLSGFRFQETIFKKIVHIDWMKWDLEAKEPKIYPSGGEPENYIAKRKHNTEVAEEMEAIWCLQLDNETLIGRKQRNISSRDELFIIENTWTGSDIFTSRGKGHIYFTEKAKQWFKEQADGFGNFESFNSKIATQAEIDAANDYLKPVQTKMDPYAHLTEKDWKVYQKYIEHAKKWMAKSKTDQTEKSIKTSLTKAIENLKNAEKIRPLGKKEQQLFNQINK